MRNTKRHLRIIAIFLLLNTINYILFPIYSLALTAGPTSPEASSFEPVDTTDMVNLMTGDFTYNIPLLEIPGPGGGYPLALSYHAGIKPDQEASWVGLGWSLNPGAINRTVNGYADDNLKEERTVRDYWGGGESKTKSHSVGITIPSIGVGLHYGVTSTQDSYKGFSGNTYAGFSAFGVQVGYSDNGDFSVGFDPIALASKSVGGEAGSSLSSLAGDLNSSLGVSISSGKLNFNASVGGVNLTQNNQNAGNISFNTKSKDIGTIPLGTYGSYNIKERYIRYWSDEVSRLETFGTLFPKQAGEFMELGYSYDINDNVSPSTFYAFDSHSMLDFTATSGNLIDPDKQIGGSLPAYDNYTVLAQGLSGSIKPYNFENGDLFRQNIYERRTLSTGQPAPGAPELEYQSLKKFAKGKVDFKFQNDFSNSLTIEAASIEVSADGMAINKHAVSAPAAGFDQKLENQHLAGSKHIEWFTNQEIYNGQAKAVGFVDYYSNPSERKLSYDIVDDYLQPELMLPGYCWTFKIDDYYRGYAVGSYTTDAYDDFDPYEFSGPCGGNRTFKDLKPKSVDIKNKIGGYMITNESGITYHYALPVYTFNEYSRTRAKDPIDEAMQFRESKNNEPYAYTWLITAMTGPDYVDRTMNGLSDDDFGYWVKFDYGLWSDSYQWRGPHAGYKSEISDDFETFSYGVKELYYLDAIETSTHKALFVKSIRKDGKGVTSRLEGGSNPRRYRRSIYQDRNPDSGVDEDGRIEFSISPVSTLKLDEIYLYKKSEDIIIDKAAGTKYNEATIAEPYPYEYSGTDIIPSQTNPYDIGYDWIAGETKIEVKYHNGYLVLDDDDIKGVLKEDLTKKALKIISFKTDYSLAMGVPNSYAYRSDAWENCVGDDFVMPIQDGCFDPGLKNCDSDDAVYEFYGQYPLAYYYNVNGSCERANSPHAGDLVMYPRLGKLTLKSLKISGKGGADIMPATAFEYKNAAHSSKHDEWDMHKVDYVNGGSRRTTANSAVDVDRWSLNQIKTSLGANITIQYESDDYSKSVLNEFDIFPIREITKLQSPNPVFEVFLSEGDLILEEYFKLGQTYQINTLFVNAEIAIDETNDEIEYYRPVSQTALDVQFTISSINNNSLIIESSAIRDVETPYFISGYIKKEKSGNKLGGGLRVKSIAIDNQSSNNLYEIAYTYSKDQRSTGVTSYDPFTIPKINLKHNSDIFDPHDEYYDKEDRMKKIKQDFSAIVNRPFRKILALAQHLPSPGVIYKSVMVNETVNSLKLPTYQEYHFTTFEESMVDRVVSGFEEDVIDNEPVKKQVVKLQNFSSRIGNLEAIKTYNENGELIASTENHYLHDDKTNENYIAQLKSEHAGQGIVEEAFHEGRRFKNDEDIFEYMGIVSKISEYPSILTSVVSTNFKKEIVTEQKNVAFDFYTGTPTKVSYNDSYGNLYLSESTPAYKKYSKMGLKINDRTNKHMLTQEAATYLYKVDNSTQFNPTDLLSASVQTWSNTTPVLKQESQPEIWRKEAGFTWSGDEDLNPDGTFSIEEFNLNPFNWANPSANNNWQKTNQITLYDHYSHALEAVDLNGNFAATRMDYKHEKVIASVVNASYNEVAFSGAEYNSVNSEDEGGVTKGSGVAVINFGHTGSYGLLVSPGLSGFTYTLSNEKADLSKKFRASVWIYLPGDAETQAEIQDAKLYYSVNGQVIKSVHPIVNKSQSKSWYLLNLDIEPSPGSDIVIGCSNNTSRGIYFDDFRVHPLDASMASYVYDQSTDEVTYILDANNFYTHYEYDEAGRLIKISRERLNFDFGEEKESYRSDHVLKEINYNYANFNKMEGDDD